MMIHVMRDGQQFGPYTLEDLNAYLAQGSLLPTDQAWWEGAPSWVSMDQVPGVVLPGMAAPAPAPVAATAAVDPNDPLAAANPAVAAAEAATISAAHAGSRKKKVIMIAGGVVGIGALAVILLFVWPGFLKDDASAGNGGGGDGVPSPAGGDTFAATVEPIFKAHNCYDCHDGTAGNPKGDFDLLKPETVTPLLTDGTLVQRLADTAEPMPPEGKGEMLSNEELEKVKAWITAGGKF